MCKINVLSNKKVYDLPSHIYWAYYCSLQKKGDSIESKTSPWLITSLQQDKIYLLPGEAAHSSSWINTH